MKQLNDNVTQAIKYAETLCRILQTEDLPAPVRMDVVKIQMDGLDDVLVNRIGLPTILDHGFYGQSIQELYTTLRTTLDLLYKLEGALTSEPAHVLGQIAPVLDLLYLVYLDNDEPYEDHDRQLCAIYTSKESAVTHAKELELANPRHTYGFSSYVKPYCIIETWNLAVNKYITAELSDGRKE